MDLPDAMNIFIFGMYKSVIGKYFVKMSLIINSM